MNSMLPNPPDPGVPDQPEPLPPVRGRGFLAERLLSPNGLLSVLMLSWGALALRRPSLARRTARAFWRRFPRLVGGTPPR